MWKKTENMDSLLSEMKSLSDIWEIRWVYKTRNKIEKIISKTDDKKEDLVEEFMEENNELFSNEIDNDFSYLWVKGISEIVDWVNKKIKIKSSAHIINAIQNNIILDLSYPWVPNEDNTFIDYEKLYLREIDILIELWETALATLYLKFLWETYEKFKMFNEALSVYNDWAKRNLYTLYKNSWDLFLNNQINWLDEPTSKWFATANYKNLLDFSGDKDDIENYIYALEKLWDIDKDIDEEQAEIYYKNALEAIKPEDMESEEVCLSIIRLSEKLNLELDREIILTINNNLPKLNINNLLVVAQYYDRHLYIKEAFYYYLYSYQYKVPNAKEELISFFIENSSNDILLLEKINDWNLEEKILSPNFIKDFFLKKILDEWSNVATLNNIIKLYAEGIEFTNVLLIESIKSFFEENEKILPETKDLLEKINNRWQLNWNDINIIHSYLS